MLYETAPVPASCPPCTIEVFVSDGCSGEVGLENLAGAGCVTCLG